jgi:integrase
LRKRITESTIKALRPPETSNRVIYDQEVPGFGVRITARGAIAFVLEYTVEGRQRRYTMGSWPELTATAARQKARQIRGDIQRDGADADPLARREGQRTAPTVAELADRYLDEYARPHKRESSVYNDESLLNQIVRPELGRLRVASVQRDHIERLHRGLRGRPYRANRALSLLSKMFSLAVEWRLRADNPCKGVRRNPEERREKWLRNEEITHLIAALAQHPNRVTANAIRLALLTGARRGELLKAQWEEFDLEREVWTKPSHHTKQRKVEHLPLSQPALALLRTLKQQADGEYVFPGKNGPLKELKSSWASIRNAAGLTGVRLHDLRHTYASHLVSGGESLHIVGKLLGHTRPETTQRYAHLADDTLRKATAKFGAIVERADGELEPAEVIRLPTRA